MVINVKEIVKSIACMLSSLPSLPGQGMFGSEKSDEMSFKVSMYDPDMPKSQKKRDIDAAASELVSEYVGCIETHYTMALEQSSPASARFGAIEIAKLCDNLRGKSDIVTSERVGRILQCVSGFVPPKKKSPPVGKIRYLGKLDKAKVYINKYVGNGDIYVIDRSVIDVKCDVKEENNRIYLDVKARTSSDGVTKYMLTV